MASTLRLRACVLLPAVGILLAGCAPLLPQVKQQLDGWVGVPSQQLIERLGAPQGDTPLEDGEHVLRWKSMSLAYRAPARACAIDFRVSPAGRITSAQSLGQSDECLRLLRGYAGELARVAY